MKVLDLNTNIGGSHSSLFEESLVFNPNEIRQYLFMVSLKDAALKLNKFE